MKKQQTKITLKTDKVVSLLKVQAQNIAGGLKRSRTCYVFN
ncbi:class I lanthipeptide [Spirosoma areae]